MKSNIKIIGILLSLFICLQISGQETFPDGTPISDWFRQNNLIHVDALGKAYCITDYGAINDSTIIQTKAIQKVIDKAYENGGGVIVIPKGTFLCGSLFFKQGTHLYLEDNATLKGSDDITDFALIPTRIEGQNHKYFAALINADGLDGFTISGKGTLNGNGHRYWRAFWLRREFNPKCTNLDEMRPRILFVSHSKNVQISGIRLINSPFWTSHFYKCENLKLMNLYIFSPHTQEKAPSSDAIDLDVCTNVLVKSCYLSVNDDAIALKGGRGPIAEKDGNNGANNNIIIEDCEFGFCHSALTCGSESIHNRNVIFRKIKISEARGLLLFKMRPDTYQNYEYLRVEDVVGDAGSIITVNPWKQFYDLKGHPQPAASRVNNIVMRNIKMNCDELFKISKSSQYNLSNFTFENLNISSQKEQNTKMDFIENIVLKDITINKRYDK
jgi:Endopolygalacturonase